MLSQTRRLNCVIGFRDKQTIDVNNDTNHSERKWSLSYRNVCASSKDSDQLIYLVQSDRRMLYSSVTYDSVSENKSDCANMHADVCLLCAYMLFRSFYLCYGPALREATENGHFVYTVVSNEFAMYVHSIVTRPRCCKNLFMLNEAEHAIFRANKSENAKNSIFIFISREFFMLSYV